MQTIISQLVRTVAGAMGMPPPETPAVRQFHQSMQIDYMKWHDGIGYDIHIIPTANPLERSQIEALLLLRGARDWRDVEALAVLDSTRAQAVLRDALRCGDHTIEIAVLRYAPHLVTHRDRIAVLSSALQSAEIGAGLAEALREVERFHPPEIIDALLRAILHRGNSNVPLLVAMLMFIYGQAKSDFDYDLRPFYFRFRETNRETPFRELCARIGVDPSHYLPR